MSDFESKHLNALRRSVPALVRYRGLDLDDKIRSILLGVRDHAHKVLPALNWSPAKKELPDVDIVMDGFPCFGDYAYCYEKSISWDETKLRWYVSWGFGIPTPKGKSLKKDSKTFVLIETDDKGKSLPPPTNHEKIALAKSDWQITWQYREDGKYLQYMKIESSSRQVNDASGFSDASSNWLKAAIDEAAEIVKRSHNRLD